MTGEITAIGQRCGLKARAEIAHDAARSGLGGEQKVKEQKRGNPNASMCITETM